MRFRGLVHGVMSRYSRDLYIYMHIYIYIYSKPYSYIYIYIYVVLGLRRSAGYGHGADLKWAIGMRGFICSPLRSII